MYDDSFSTALTNVADWSSHQCNPNESARGVHYVNNERFDFRGLFNIKIKMKL